MPHTCLSIIFAAIRLTCFPTFWPCLCLRSWSGGAFFLPALRGPVRCGASHFQGLRPFQRLFLLLFRFFRRACSPGRCCGPFGDVNIGGSPTSSFFMKFRDITRAQTRKITMKTPKTILVWALLLSDVSRRYVNVAAVIRAPTTALKPEIMAICIRILLSDRLDFFLSVESFLCWTSLSSDFSSRICAAAGTFSGPAHRRYITSTSLLRRQRSPV